MAAIRMQFQAILPAQKYSNFYINSRAIACKIRAICAGNAWITMPLALALALTYTYYLLKYINHELQVK